ncbi:hypothetical protein TWF718_008445 [Orbilia javanica]|uniref:Ankyrin repeat protein n=1 Tax=Orbilia javanica TaxID=47235 RepID=A0AAN8MSM1_9PEZI
MATSELVLPLPTNIASFPKYLAENRDKPIRELLRPYLNHENRVRELFAQDPENPVLANNYLGLLPVYAGHEEHIEIRARDFESESEEERAKYLLPLNKGARKLNGEKAVVGLDNFKKNFRIYCASALDNIDWRNVVAAGPSVMTALLTIPEEHQKPCKSLREYYKKISIEQIQRKEEPFIDLYIYGLDEAAGLKKLEHIESTVRDNTPWEVTCVRTRETLTIVSRFPNRPIRIQLCLYSSISQLLHSPAFGVECACVAWDGEQIYTTPRGIVSWMLQSNTVDISRLDLLGNYESSLYKYWFYGFEVFYENLRRNSIDPSIYKFAINRLHGLSKLLVYENILSTLQNPPKFRHLEKTEEKYVAREWEVSIKYGRGYNMREGKNMKLRPEDTEDDIYNQDFKLNEWKGQAQENRIAYLHRHPAFIGSFEYVKGDCCGDCPIPQTAEEISLQAEDDQHYVRGDLSFLEPPTQGTPETEETWADTAYARAEDEIFLRAITDLDVEAVRNLIKSWPEDSLKKNVNRRSYTGRTPLQLAVVSSTPEIIGILIDAGARLTARLSDGRNSLHLAAARGDCGVVKLLLLKSEQNEELKMEREDRERAEKSAARRLLRRRNSIESIESFEDIEPDDEDDIEVVSTIHDATSISVHTGASSFVEVTKKPDDPENDEFEDASAIDDILDINLADRTYRMAPFHYAILHDNKEVLTMLVSEFGADILRQIAPIARWLDNPNIHGPGARYPSILALTLVQYIGQKDRREDMLRTLLKLGASSSQVDNLGVPAIARIVQVCDLDCLEIMFEEDGASAVVSAQLPAKFAVRFSGPPVIGNALIAAISQGDEEKALLLLNKGVSPKFSAEKLQKNFYNHPEIDPDPENRILQPAELAILLNLLRVFEKCLELGVDPSRLTYETAARKWSSNSEQWRHEKGNMTYLDLLRKGIPQCEKLLKGLPKPVVPLPSGLVEGTYKYWLASRKVDIENGKRAKDSLKKRSRGYLYHRDAYRIEKSRLEGLKARYQELVALAVSKGAKTFQELTEIGAGNAPKDEDEANVSKTLKNDLNTRPDSPVKDGDQEAETEQDLFLEISPSFEYPGVSDESLRTIYNRIFQAAWDGDQETLQNEFQNPTPGGTAPKVSTQNELGDTILSIAEYREHPKEFVDLIHEIAASQGFESDIRCNKEKKTQSPEYPVPVPAPNARGIRYGIEPPFSVYYHSSNKLFSDITCKERPNIKVLEEALKAHGIRQLTHYEMYFSEQLELSDDTLKMPTYLGLSIDGKKREYPRERHPSLKATSLVDCVPDRDQPIALYAAYHGLLGVLEWFETDGPELALRENQKRLEEKLRLRQLDIKNSEENGEDGREYRMPHEMRLAQADELFIKMIQRANSSTIKHWLGVNHPLLPHASVLNLLEGTNKTDKEKVAWHTKVLKFIISRSGPESIESTTNSQKLSPIALAAQIRNKWAMEALINLGANLYADSANQGLTLIHHIFSPKPNVDTVDLIKGCLDVLPQDYKKWAFANKTKPPSEKSETPHRSLRELPLAVATIVSPEILNLNSRNPKGDLPLHTAAKGDSLEELQFLLDISTPEQVLTEDTDGMTVADIADRIFYDKVLSNLERKLDKFPDYFDDEDEYEVYNLENIPFSKSIRDNPIGLVKNPNPGLRMEEWGLDRTDIGYKSGEKMVYKVFKDAARKAGRRRILVSLREVNKTMSSEARNEGWGLRDQFGVRHDDIVFRWREIVTRWDY